MLVKAGKSFLYGLKSDVRGKSDRQSSQAKRSSFSDSALPFFMPIKLASWKIIAQQHTRATWSVLRFQVPIHAASFLQFRQLPCPWILHWMGWATFLPYSGCCGVANR